MVLKGYLKMRSSGMKSIVLMVLPGFIGVAHATATVVDMQLPFYDGKSYQCTQNSSDTPTHNGPYTQYDLDFGMPSGSIVVATADGTMHRATDRDKSGALKGFGLYARIDISGNEYWIMNGHLSGYIAQDGQRVVAGQPIAYSGNTGLSIGSGGGYHVHVGAHSGTGVGISHPMNVWALDKNTGLLSYYRTGTSSETGFVCGLGSAGHKYESRPIGKIFSDFMCRQLNGTNGLLCWQGNPTTCEDGHDHVRYFKNAQGASQSESDGNTWRWCLQDSGKVASVFEFLKGGYGVGGGDDPSNPTDPSQGQSPLNLTLDFDVMSLAGIELVAGQVALVKASQIDLRAKVGADGADLSDWMVKGKDSIEVDFFAKIGSGGWMHISRQHIKADNLKKGSTKTETVRYTVPDTGGQTISFQVKIDTEEEAVERNEGDNASRVETFTVKDRLDVNLVVPWAKLTNGRTNLTADECYGFEAAVRNIGRETPTQGTRLSYQVLLGGSWQQVADDGVEAVEMAPGRDQVESVSDDGCVRAPSVPGSYQMRAYADGPNSIAETDEGDNFYQFPVTVSPKPMPDLVVAWAKFTNGRTSLTEGECYGMEAAGKNIGGVRPSADTRLSYQIYNNGWKQIADDGVEKEIMNPNQEHWEYVSNDGCVIAPSPGWYRFRACHDAPGTIAEMNEQNNCTEFSAEVRPKPMPNLIVSQIGFTDGTVHKAKSKAHPYFWVCNVGNGPVRADFRSTYYRHGTAVDSDGTEAGLLGPGQCSYEEISGDSFQVPSTPGSYELKVILDTSASQPESNEGDNIATTWFQVVKK